MNEGGPARARRSRAWTLDALTITSLSGVVVVAATALGVLALGASRATGTWAIVLSLGAASGLVLWIAQRRRKGLRRLERRATALLGGDAGDPGASTGPRVPVELEPLAGALRGLGRRIDTQLKDVAKKSRNLEALIDAIDEPILATDNLERVLLCNSSAERLLGAGTSIVGRPIAEVFTQTALLDLHGAARAGQTRRDRVRVTTQLGQRVFQVTASPVPAAWGSGVFGAVLALRDVTELEQAEAVKTDFVANASHELRTPVAAIRGAAETLATTSDDPVMSERLRGMIVDNALRLEEMLRDLLDLSRLESPGVKLDMQPLRLSQVRADVEAMSGEACSERRLALAWSMDPEIEGVRTDRTLIMLILRNLVENATKFAFEGTTIDIVGRITRSDENGERVVRLSVSDKGVGIPLAQQERVFERYYQVDPGRSSQLKGWRKGTGLGLAIVKHAAKALGGRAWLTSVWGQGTTVHVELPAGE